MRASKLSWVNYCENWTHVAYWHKADVAERSTDVRFWGSSGHRVEATDAKVESGAIG
jgi:hypothetical protein